MKKILILFMTVAMFSSCSDNSSETNTLDLKSEIDKIGENYIKTNNTTTSKISKRKAGFMAVANVLSGAAAAGPSLALGPFAPYGILWGGFMGSAGAAVLYNDMFSRSSSEEQLVLPIVRRNPDPFFNSYEQIGVLHNILMLRYCNNNNMNRGVFDSNGLPSSFIKNEMIASNYFNPSTSTKNNFVNNILPRYNNTFSAMKYHAAEQIIIAKLKSINTESNLQKDALFTVTDFIQTNEMMPVDYLFSYIDEVEQAVRNTRDDLSTFQKEELYYSFEILHHSYALWYVNGI